MIGFYDLVGVGIVSLSKKNAVRILKRVGSIKLSLRQIYWITITLTRLALTTQLVGLRSICQSH